MSQTVRLALRLLMRDFRAGELRVLVAAIVLAVASVGTVAFFADRVKAGLAQQANLLLGADLMVSGDRPLPNEYADEARKRGLLTSTAIRFNSMVQVADANPATANAVLTDVKAVANGYPLRGAIALVEPGTTERHDAQGIPNRGDVWIDTRLADRLGATVGTKIAVGEATLTVTSIIAQEPEIAGLTFAPGPKVLLNLDDVPATKLLQPGNRATWRLLIAGRAMEDVERFQQWLAGVIKPAQRVESVRDLCPEV